MEKPVRLLRQVGVHVGAHDEHTTLGPQALYGAQQSKVTTVWQPVVKQNDIERVVGVDNGLSCRSTVDRFHHCATAIDEGFSQRPSNQAFIVHDENPG